MQYLHAYLKWEITGITGIHTIPIIFMCILQGIFCDTGIPCTFYGGNICSVAYLWQFTFFFLCNPDCSKRLPNENSYWKCVSRLICSLACAIHLISVKEEMCIAKVLPSNLYILCCLYSQEWLKCNQSHYREVLRWEVSNGARHNWKCFLA